MSSTTIRIASFLFLAFLQVLAAAGQTEADLQFQQGQQLYNSGKSTESAALFENALNAYKQAGNAKGIADTSRSLGMAYRRLGRFADATRILNEALKLHESLGDEEGAGLDWIEIATVCQRQGNYDEGLSASEKGLSIEEKLGNKAGIARALQTLGSIYHRKAEYDKAIDYLERALSIANEAGDKRVAGAALGALGSVYWILGDFDRALDYYDKDQKVLEELGDKFGLSGVIGNRGLIHWNQGDLKLALEEFDQCMALDRESGDKQGQAINYFNIGLLKMNQGNYAEAQDSLQKALVMAREIGDKGLEGVTYEGLGTMNRDLGNYDLALNFLQKSLNVSAEIGETRAVAYALRGIASIHEKRGNYQAALQQYRKAFRIFQKENEKKAIALILQSLGEVYSELGDQKRALSNYQAALAIQGSIGNRPGMGRSYTLIAEIYHTQGRMAEAEEAITKSVDILRKAGESDALWPALFRRGQICRDMGKTAEAVRWMKEAVDEIEKQREDVQLAEQKSGFLEDKLDVYDDLIEVLAKTDNIADAFDYLERSKARAFLDLLSEARIDPQSTVSPELYRKKKKILSQLMGANKKIGEEYGKQKVDGAVIQKLEQERSRFDEDYVNLLLDIRKQNPRYAALQYPQPLKLPDAQELAGDHAVLMDYHLGKKDSLLFVITGSEAQVFHLPGGSKLSSQVQELLQSIQKPEAAWEASGGFYTKYVTMAGLLYNELLKPAERWLSGNPRLIIVPDGALNYLPFESLLTHRSSGPIDFAKLPYVALNHEIQYAPSVSVLAAVQQTAQDALGNRKALMAFADPAVGAAGNPQRITAANAAFRTWSRSLPDLPYARTEVEEISKLYPKEEVRVLMGKDASEENVKTADLSRYRMVHFASHGLIDEERPEFSALVLTPGVTGEEDGFLTMREVFDLKLNADLVVLSACKSGLGREIRGEGMDGLSRAFFFAGTSRVLVSLWNVYDPSTAEFMTTFYRNLKDPGTDETEALQRARLQMIRSSKYNHPYYWAPFVLIGRN